MVLWWCEPHDITETSHWAQWRPKSPASRLFLNRLFRYRSKETSKFRVACLYKASNAENVSLWWHHNVIVALWEFWCFFFCCSSEQIVEETIPLWWFFNTHSLNGFRVSSIFVFCGLLFSRQLSHRTYVGYRLFPIRSTDIIQNNRWDLVKYRGMSRVHRTISTNQVSLNWFTRNSSQDIRYKWLEKMVE